MSSLKSDYDHPDVLQREDSVLLVIDVQDRLLPATANREAVVENIVRLVKFARIIGLPVVLTEQEKLGPTTAPIKDEVPHLSPITRITFDAFKCEEFVSRLESLGRKTLIITGLETHVCISQTALQAAPRFNVHAVSDAVSSRTADNWRVALQRMERNGIVITSTEMVIYELLERAGTDEFRATLSLVK